MKSPYDVIIKPIITEKTMAITEEGKYTFVVAADAEKPPLTLLTMTARLRDLETSPARQLLSRRL